MTVLGPGANSSVAAERCSGPKVPIDSEHTRRLEDAEGDECNEDSTPIRAASAVRWLKRHRRFTLRYTPTHSPWLNRVERWFSELTTKNLRRSTHRSVAELRNDINEWVEHWSTIPLPFVWHKTADEILDNLASYLQRNTTHDTGRQPPPGSRKNNPSLLGPPQRWTASATFTISRDADELNAYLQYDPDVYRDKTILLPCNESELNNVTKFLTLHLVDVDAASAAGDQNRSAGGSSPMNLSLGGDGGRGFSGTAARIGGSKAEA